MSDLLFQATTKQPRCILKVFVTVMITFVKVCHRLNGFSRI